MLMHVNLAFNNLCKSCLKNPPAYRRFRHDKAITRAMSAVTDGRICRACKSYPPRDARVAGYGTPHDCDARAFHPSRASPEKGLGGVTRWPVKWLTPVVQSRSGDGII